jgi:hypothetical protein
LRFGTRAARPPEAARISLDSVPGGAARLAAEAGTAVFRISFERCIGGDGEPDLLELMRQSFDELKLLSVRRR